MRDKIYNFMRTRYGNDQFSSFLTWMGLILIIGGIIELIRIISGSKARKWEQKRQQSVARLRNPDYAWKLKQAGYPVPEEYLR